MEGSIDRISSLPESVLHHILSFLLIEDAIQFCPTSKRLNHVWTTLPYLDLGRDFFPSYYDSDVEIHRNRETLSSFVEQMLMSRRTQGLSIVKFRFHVDKLDGILGGHLDRWVQILVKSNIKELILEIDSYPVLYDLPPVLLNSPSLHTLALSSCKIPCVDRIKLLSLRKLCLKTVFADEQTFKDIIMSVSRSLEYLEITFCHGFKRLDVSGLLRLKLLKVTQTCRIKDEEVEDVVLDEIFVDAPNLENFSYFGGFRPVKISIVTAHESRIKRIRLSGVCICSMWLRDLLSRLPLLEDLGLSELNLKSIQISSSSLIRLTLGTLFDFKCREVVDVTIDAPNLQVFKYEGRISCISFNNKDLVVPEVDIFLLDLRSGEEYDPDFSIKLMQFLHKFHHSKIVRLNSSFFKRLVLPSEKIPNFVAPLTNTKHLLVRGIFHKSDQSVDDVVPGLLDSMLWMCPNLNIISLKEHNLDDENPNPIDLWIKFTFEELMGKEDECSARNTIPWRCWRNSLTHVEYRLQRAHEELERSLTNYFISNASVLKRIVASHADL